MIAAAFCGMVIHLIAAFLPSDAAAHTVVPADAPDAPIE